jgi:ribosome biogenesis protein BMS1
LRSLRSRLSCARPRNETNQLSLFISRIKFRPLQFRSTHPYVIADRHEDVTPLHEQEAAKERGDRRVVFYGYVRGCNLRPGTAMHVLGLGDYTPTSISVVADPLPFPDKVNGKAKKIGTKDLKIYAPSSEVGSVHLDRDGV